MIKKEFNLGGVKWKVVYQDNIEDDSDCLGLCDYAKSKIYLANAIKGKPVPRDLQEQVFYHELTHAILSTLGKEELSENEEFVQQFSLLLHQFNKD